MQIANFRISLHNHGSFKLDGGAMFGAVPKTLWSRSISPDEQNRLTLATRSLLLEDDQRSILVDVGNGDKWDEKQRSIFEFQTTPLSELTYNPADVTDIIITHLHFDHAAGISQYDDKGNLEL